jgi:hypothetical protein
MSDNVIKPNLRSQKRSHLPSPMVSRNDVSLWSILKHCIGKELSKIAMPVVFNEPVSFLQRIAENGEYIHILKEADLCDDPVDRMELVCAFAVAALSSNWLRMNKPFNPILGETYELELKDQGFRIVCEQVSHHPPVSAYHGESEHYAIHGSVQPKLKFWGKSIEVRPDGYINVKLKRHNEVYTWRNVNCVVHNIIVGKLWFEQYGLMEIINHSNGMRASLNFKAAGWFGRDLHRVEGFITAKDKSSKLRFLYGKWTDYLKSATVEDYDDYMKENAQSFRVPDEPGQGQPAKNKMFGKLNSLTRTLTGSSDVPDNAEQEGTENGSEIPKSDSSHSLDIPNSKLLWVVDPRPLYSAEYYNFTLYSMFLNQLDESTRERLAPTDSRLRPDVRCLEEGDIDAAAAEKNRLEEKQREARKLRKKQKQEFSPLWFKSARNEFTKEDDWLYTGTYWNRDYSLSEDIY